MKRYLLSTFSYSREGVSTKPVRVESELADLSHNARDHFIGSLLLITLPWRRMGKNFIDTFKPYKNSYQYKRDLLQISLGFWETMIALLFTVFYPILIMANVVRLVAGFQVKPLVIYTFIFPLEIVSLLVSGLSQIATFPLTLLRIPLRSLITYIKGVPLIENNAGIKSLIKKGEEAQAQGLSTGLIDKVLKEKIFIAVNRRQPSINKAIMAVYDQQHPFPITYKTFLSSKKNVQKIGMSDREETQTNNESRSCTM